MSGIEFQGYLQAWDAENERQQLKAEVLLDCHCDYELGATGVDVELTSAVLFGWDIISILTDDEVSQLESQGLDAWEAENERQQSKAEAPEYVKHKTGLNK